MLCADQCFPMFENLVYWRKPSNKKRGNFMRNSHKTVVDRPTQLICTSDIYFWVGGGNPCGAADFCIGGPCSQKKLSRFNFFLKDPNYVRTNGQNAKNRAKNRQKPPKNSFFQLPSAVCMGLAWNVMQHFRLSLARQPEGLKKTGFLEHFCPVLCILSICVHIIRIF